MTYSVLANAIGKPKAFRAVGSALRHNPFAPIVRTNKIINHNIFIIYIL